MSYEKALAILARDDRFKSTIYAINTLLIHKGIYSQREFQQLFVATRATATTSIMRNVNKARSLLKRGCGGDLIGAPEADIFESQLFHLPGPQHVPSIDHQRTRHFAANSFPIQPAVLLPLRQ